jgi:hypothetical protein
MYKNTRPLCQHDYICHCHTMQAEEAQVTGQQISEIHLKNLQNLNGSLSRYTVFHVL